MTYAVLIMQLREVLSIELSELQVKVFDIANDGDVIYNKDWIGWGVPNWKVKV